MNKFIIALAGIVFVVAVTADEFHSKMSGSGYGASNKDDRLYWQYHVTPANADIPKSVDWRQKGAVTSVKKQGGCPICWAFSGNGALEAAHFIKTGNLIELSAQYLADCVKQNETKCYWDSVEAGWTYILNNGIVTDKSYPYEEKKDKCRYDPKNDAGVTVKGYGVIPENDELALVHALATVGPVTASINSQKIQKYTGGVFNDTSCSKEPNHSVLIVGYGTDDKEGDFYIIKNSYGTSWGENGFMRWARNKDNLCGIAQDAVYPIINDQTIDNPRTTTQESDAGNPVIDNQPIDKNSRPFAPGSPFYDRLKKLADAQGFTLNF